MAEQRAERAQLLQVDERTEPMWTHLGLSPIEAVLVIVSALGVYAAFTLLIRLLGQRSVARMSTFDVLVVLVLGAVAGRVITGSTPTLTAGVLALVVLFTLHLAVQRLARRRWFAVLVRDRAVLLMAEGRPIEAHLRRTGISRDDLRTVLRNAGVRSSKEVACVVLEPAGGVSVIRRGALLERDLFEDVVGVELIADDVFEPA
jgi:uncharacterized membrane protein YcaP (DUF421 family)